MVEVVYLLLLKMAYLCIIEQPLLSNEAEIIWTKLFPPKGKPIYVILLTSRSKNRPPVIFARISSESTKYRFILSNGPYW